MQPIQIFLLLFFLLAIFKVVGRYRGNELGFRGTVVWIVFWLLAAAVVINPNSTSYVAKTMGVGRGADAVVYVSLAGLFFIVFRLMVKIEKMNREMTTLVRGKALEEKK